MSLNFQRAVFYKPKHVMTKAYYNQKKKSCTTSQLTS